MILAVGLAEGPLNWAFLVDGLLADGFEGFDVACEAVAQEEMGHGGVNPLEEVSSNQELRVVGTLLCIIGVKASHRFGESVLEDSEEPGEDESHCREPPADGLGPVEKPSGAAANIEEPGNELEEGDEDVHEEGGEVGSGHPAVVGVNQELPHPEKRNGVSTGTTLKRVESLHVGEQGNGPPCETGPS